MGDDLVQNGLETILSQDINDEVSVIDQIEKLIKKFGIKKIEAWRNSVKTRNTLLHELVEKKCPNVIQYLLVEYNLDRTVHREADGKTPIELAQAKGYDDIVDALGEFDENKSIAETPDDDESEPSKKNRMNIVWIDLEMTSIEHPKIMECAVIITDKNMNEIERAQWVIHYDKEVLDTLGEWHQEQFKSLSNGGNGLFQECIDSKLSEAEVEEKLLAILKRHCPEKECSLAGSSIHTDKDVLKQRMPRAHDYLHYRIIDVSSFQGALKRWAPKRDSDFVRKLSNIGRDTVNHRAMDDIEYSIELLKLFYPLLTGRPYRSRRPGDRPLNRNGRNHELEASSLANVNRSIGNFETERSTYYADEKALEARLNLDKTTDVQALNLNKKFQPIYNRNPHLREIFIDDPSKFEIKKKFEKENRFLDLQTQIANHKQNITHNITTEHWGTRKLLLTDIEFLTDYGGSGKYLVIYVGAAPGIHINHLSDLFPDLEFVLIDTKKVETKKTSSIHIRSRDFMDDIVKEYSKSKKRLLLISNVHVSGSQADSDDNILKEMQNQQHWHLDMKPIASLLTFHFPRTTNRIEYFEGDLILEPWASRRPSSCRLLVSREARLIDYNIKQLKSSMGYFQSVLRTNFYEHDLKDSNTDGLDHCYDCRSEIFILSEYLSKIQKVPKDKVLEAVSKMSQKISEAIQDKNRPLIAGNMRTLAAIPKK
ncbi:unnamed protein product [Rotaria magnacalcarata]|uniref:Cap-specific mRNA (nucleoside-2'-O-)-methyltransferase n=2 Tax=Rotaria magnacalcarata TaxID=392030 RepID=A0A816GT88_9BILA|nr:unnamed protein product [Rotaria magnacalcarata]